MTTDYKKIASQDGFNWPPVHIGVDEHAKSNIVTITNDINGQPDVWKSVIMTLDQFNRLAAYVAAQGDSRRSNCRHRLASEGKRPPHKGCDVAGCGGQRQDGDSFCLGWT